ncbi:MAG: c-type cytochrome domain-containing protein [Myxococcota bacterium]
MTPLLLVALLACDDDIFPAAHNGEAIVGDGYTDVVAVFDGGCVSCHGATSPSGGLDLVTDPCAAMVDVTSSTYTAVLVAPGDSAGSVLWHKMADTGTYGGVMPFGAALPAASVATVAAWIDAGAPCDEDTAARSLPDQSGGPR